MKLIYLQKTERPAYEKDDQYSLSVELPSGKIQQVNCEFKDIEPIILELHGLGIQGHRRYDSMNDSHLTEWEIPSLTK